LADFTGTEKAISGKHDSVSMWYRLHKTQEVGFLGMISTTLEALDFAMRILGSREIGQSA
jgi:hypothetical protein